MNNYQLYRTNLFLGGQLKWDLVVNRSQNQLYVADFKLSPISNNIPYINIDTPVTYTHQYNVKTYYNVVRDNFYNSGLDSTFATTWPVLCESGEKLDSYSNMYDMGCKRSKWYNKYNKQFEFFCPVWLEHVTDDISFKISIRDMESNNVIASKILSISDEPEHIYHDRFVQYFKNYIKDCNLNTGNDDLINISFENNTATISGLDTTSGILITHDVNNLINDLTSIERTMLDFDYLLMKSMMNNNVIAKQLFNFNICFDIEDILSGSILDTMLGTDIIVSVDVLMGNEVLEKRDFGTNYEYIKRTLTSKDIVEISDNILDYLHDYECVDLISKNKFDQNICHWVLVDNEDYIFNLYEGFSGLDIDIDNSNKLTIFENAHNYGNTPNQYIAKHDRAQNTIGWFSNYTISKWSDFYKYINNVDKYKYDGTFIESSMKYVNNIKYNYLPNIDGGVYLLGLVVPNKLLLNIRESFNCDEISEDLYLLKVKDLIILLTTNLDCFAFNRIQSLLNNTALNSDTSAELNKMLKSAVIPTTVNIANTISYSKYTSPNINTKEIVYYKDGDNEYVLRYDGKIKPMFVKDSSNVLYYKDYISEDKVGGTAYTRYNNRIYDPVYPSIGFCAINKITNWSYDNVPNVKVLEHNDPVSIYSQLNEYSWFNYSKCLVLMPEINFSYVNTKEDGYKTIDEIIYAHLVKIYGDDNQLVDYIKSKYRYSTDWDYYSIYNVDDMQYNITLKLR